MQFVSSTVLQSCNIINITVKLFPEQPLTLTMILKTCQKQITVEHDRDHHSTDEDEACDEELNVEKDAEGEGTFLSECKFAGDSPDRRGKELRM